MPALVVDDLSAGGPLSLVLDGRSVVEHAVAALRRAGLPTVLVVGPRTLAVTEGARPPAGDTGLCTVEVATSDIAVAVRAALSICAGDAPTHVLVHDPCAPLLPAAAVDDLVARVALAPEAVHALSRPVTDTVKIVRDGEIRETVPREGLRDLASPVVLPIALVDDLEPCATLVELLDAVCRRAPLVTVNAPVLGKVVHDSASAIVLRALRDLAIEDRT